MKYKKKQELAKLLKSKPSFNVVIDQGGKYKDIGTKELLTADQINDYDMCFVINVVKGKNGYNHE